MNLRLWSSSSKGSAVAGFPPGREFPYVFARATKATIALLMEDELDVVMEPKPPLGIRCLPPVTDDVKKKSRL